MLTQSRELLLSTLRDHPELAGNIEVSTPVCDFEKRTACGECVRLCPTNACDLLGSGRFALEPAYGVGCGLCAEACEDHALTMESHVMSDLAVPDPDAEQKRKDAERARAEAEKAKAEAKVKLNKLLDQWRSWTTSAGAPIGAVARGCRGSVALPVRFLPRLAFDGAGRGEFRSSVRTGWYGIR